MGESSQAYGAVLLALGVLGVVALNRVSKRYAKRRHEVSHKAGQRAAADALALRVAAQADDTTERLLEHASSFIANNEKVPGKMLAAAKARIDALLHKSSAGDDLWSNQGSGAWASAMAKFEAVVERIDRHNAAMEVEHEGRMVTRKASRDEIDERLRGEADKMPPAGVLLSDEYAHWDERVPMSTLVERARYLEAHSEGQYDLRKIAGTWVFRRKPV